MRRRADIEQIAGSEIGDFIGRGAGGGGLGNVEPVILCAAGQRILPRPAGQYVLPRPAGQRVIASLTGQRVIACSTGQRIIASPAGQRVIAGTTI